jgi:murein L,D-transpeptidase YcbB/YkuD
VARGGIAAAALISFLAAAGCGQAPKEHAAVDALAATESARSARELDSELEAVEARLYSGRATVRLWQELAERHKGVSALACKNAEVHSEGMAIADRKDRAQLAKHRVAKSDHGAVVTDAHVTGYQTAKAAPGKK